MINNTLFLLTTVGIFTLPIFEGSAQSSATVIDKAEIGMVKPARKYAVGLMTLSRISVVNVNYQFDKSVWTLYGGGVSALRYSSNRTFWSVGFAYAGVVKLKQGIGPDIRITWDPNTNFPIQSNLGTRTEVWKYSYYTVPIAFHHLLTKSKRTNLYVTGGITLDWLRRNVREITATYDGRFDVPYSGRFQEVSATVQGGLGVYQPLGENWVVMAGATLGHTFFSELEQDITARGAPGIASFDLRMHYRLPSFGSPK